MIPNKITLFLTGSSGRVGNFVLKRLVESGFTVRAYDWKEPQERIPGVDYNFGDINDLEKLSDTMKDCSAVIHLAAIPSPNLCQDVDLMQVNVMGTFKVFEAALRNKIRKVIQASSINALGAGFGKNIFKVEYLPIDEEHPCNINDSYSLSKNIIEQIADYFWKKYGIYSISLRFPSVLVLEQISAYIQESKQRFCIVLTELENMNDNERFEYFESFFTNSDKGRILKKINKKEDFEVNEDEKKKELFKRRISIYALKDFLAYIDISDAANAIICALNAQINGAHRLFVNGPDIGVNCETRRIIKIFFPYVKEIRKDFIGKEPLIDTSKAERLIGFKAQLSMLNCY